MWQRIWQRKMVGGLVFGSPAWMPERIEETFEKKGDGSETAEGKVAEEVKDRTGLVALLRKVRLPRTSQLTPAVIDQVRDAGEKPVLSLVYNGLPTQPEFALPGALVRLAMEEVHLGLMTIQRGVMARRTILALDRHDFAVGAYRKWRKIFRKESEARAGVRMLLNRYPQGDPTMLAKKLFGAKLLPGNLPTRVGRVIVDPVSCWAIGRYLRTGQVFTERPVQVFVQAEEHTEPRLVMGHIGERLTEFCKRYKVEVEGKQVIINGMLAGKQVDIEGTRIEAATESIAIREPAEPEKAAACLSCGWCVDVCLTRLTPVHLMQLVEYIDADRNMAEVPGLLRGKAARESLYCIGCGLCTYVCPTRLPLMAQTLHLRNRVTTALQSDPAGEESDEP